MVSLWVSGPAKIDNLSPQIQCHPLEVRFAHARFKGEESKGDDR